MRHNDTELPPFKYLLETSRASLREFQFKKLSVASISSKQMKQLLNDWIEQRALALLAEWLDTYGEELVLLAAENKSSEKVKIDAIPVAPPKRTYEFWRDPEQRRSNSRRRAG